MKAMVNMNTMNKCRIAVCVYTTNAAQTIRAVEIAKAVVAHSDLHCQRKQQNEQSGDVPASKQTQTALSDALFLRFYAYRGSLPGQPKRKIDYEHLIHAAGFNVEYFGLADDQDSATPQHGTKACTEKQNGPHATAIPVLDDEMWLAFLQAERNHEGMFPPPYEDRAAPFILAVMDTLNNFDPDIVIYGAFPEVAIASAIQGWKTVSFTPLPLDIFREFMQKKGHALGDATNDMQKKKCKNPYEVIQNAAYECGLKFPESSSKAINKTPEFLKTIRPSHTVVCDFECFYRNQPLPSDVTVVGPIISLDMSKGEDVEQVVSWLMQPPSSAGSEADIEGCPQIKVLLNMGSTGESSAFMEAVKALCYAKQGTFHSVVIVPSTVPHEPIENDDRVQSAIRRGDLLLLYNKFVPIGPIMRFVDVSLCHGGQQTIQCALAAGVPIVGTPIHGEQLYNLENVERSQAGVCIMPADWKGDNIRNILVQVGGKFSTYKEAAARMQINLLNMWSGVDRAASVIWAMINN